MMPYEPAIFFLSLVMRGVGPGGAGVRICRGRHGDLGGHIHLDERAELCWVDSFS